MNAFVAPVTFAIFLGIAILLPEGFPDIQKPFIFYILLNNAVYFLCFKQRSSVGLVFCCVVLQSRAYSGFIETP